MAADEIIIETTSAEVIEVGVPGPQGPAGAAGTGLETLTTKGDTLYRGETTGERLPIGTIGQILRVSSSGIPEWGAAPASGVSSVAGKTGAVTLDSTDIFTDQALQISDAGVADCNAVFVYGGVFNNRPTYYATKDTFVYWDGSNWVINHNGDDQYFGTATTYPWQAVWSLGDGANPLPVVTQAASHEFEQVVGQRTNPTARGDAASKNVGTGANDVAAGNHTHTASAISDSTTAGRALLTAADAAAQRTSLGLGTLATQSGTFSGTSSGTNTGDQTITLTGDVTGSGTGSFVTTIAANAVVNADLAQVATNTIKGRATAGTGNVEDLTATQVRSIINVADGATANSSDATLLARANHTGTQAASTITGLAAIATSGSASDLGSGTVPIGRLGASGTPSGSTYLAGDNSWKAVTGGVSAMQSIAINFVLN